MELGREAEVGNCDVVEVEVEEAHRRVDFDNDGEMYRVPRVCHDGL